MECCVCARYNWDKSNRMKVMKREREPKRERMRHGPSVEENLCKFRWGMDDGSDYIL